MAKRVLTKAELEALPGGVPVVDEDDREWKKILSDGLWFSPDTSGTNYPDDVRSPDYFNSTSKNLAYYQPRSK